VPSSLTSKKKLAAYQTEAAFQRAVEEKAAMLGWYTWHVNLPMRSKAGFPDVLCIKDRLLWLELKVYYENGKAGRVMPEQVAFHERLRAAGQEVLVVYNDDDGWRELLAVLSDGRLA